MHKGFCIFSVGYPLLIRRVNNSSIPMVRIPSTGFILFFLFLFNISFLNHFSICLPLKVSLVLCPRDFCFFVHHIKSKFFVGYVVKSSCLCILHTVFAGYPLSIKSCNMCESSFARYSSSLQYTYGRDFCVCIADTFSFHACADV